MSVTLQVSLGFVGSGQHPRVVHEGRVGEVNGVVNPYGAATVSKESVAAVLREAAEKMSPTPEPDPIDEPVAESVSLKVVGSRMLEHGRGTEVQFERLGTGEAFTLQTGDTLILHGTPEVQPARPLEVDWERFGNTVASFMEAEGYVDDARADVKKIIASIVNRGLIPYPDTPLQYWEKDEAPATPGAASARKIGGARVKGSGSGRA
jgi:hypothetical protein